MLKNAAIWCILKCILIKFQGNNSLKISMFIATTTKKDVSLLGEKGGVGTRACSRKMFKKMVQKKAASLLGEDRDMLYRENFGKNCEIRYILKCICIN